MLLSIGQTALLLGVSISTLRRWEHEGHLTPKTRTKGGHRRYALGELRSSFFPNTIERARLTIAYARVSTSDQRSDLARQVSDLTQKCEAQGWAHMVIADLGSGLNAQKPGLQKLLRLICSGEVARLVVTHEDRLLRFGSKLLLAVCKIFETEVVILNDAQGENFEADLVNDVLEILTVFSSRLYGRRAHQNRLQRAS